MQKIILSLCSKKFIFLFLFIIPCRYMSRVELVKFLIESNYYDVPSIEDLMLSHTARFVFIKLPLRTSKTSNNEY